MSDNTKTSQEVARAQSPEARKKTQKALAWGGLALILGVAIVGTLFFENRPPEAIVAPVAAQSTQTQIATPGASISAQDVWVGKSTTDLQIVNDRTNSLTASQQAILDRMDRLEKGTANQTAASVPGGQGMPQQMAPAQQPLRDLSRVNQAPTAPPPPPPVSNIAQTLPPPPPEQVKLARTENPEAERLNQMSGMGITVGYMKETSASGKTTAVATPSTAAAAAKQAEDDREDITNYIPAGSFARVTLLGGMDAPTGGQAQSTPQPVLFRADGNAILPNKFKFQVKECLGVGAGYGDIASERAYIRAESLSCVLENGETVDVEIKGYIAGEDGKTGMRGRLVSKQGQMLANALMAGIGSGIGQAFQQGATTQSISALGTTQTVSNGQAFQAGASAGVGKAFDRLANYYISLAEKTFPVIEIDAGRTVDLVLTKGVSFRTTTSALRKSKTKETTWRDVAEAAKGKRHDNGSYSYYD